MTPLRTIEPSGLLTHSRMTCFKTCPRKHLFQYELGIRTDVTARPLRMGAAIHRGIDLRAKGKSQDEAIAGAVASYDELPSWATTEELVYEWAIEREVVARLLAGYFWYWGDDESEVVASECSFRLPIYNPDTGRATPTFEYGGQRDKIIRLPDGRLAIREHKTCSEDLSAESDYWKRLRIDQQITTYYLSAIDMGYEVQTVEYDVIRKPTIRPSLVPLLDADGFKIVLDSEGKRVRTKDGKKWRESGDSEKGYVLQSRRETTQEYGERLTQDITERPEFYFARREIPRLQADLDEFRHELWQIQHQIRASELNNRWFRNTAACRQFNRPCEYFSLCTNGIDPREHGLPDGFVQVDDVHPELTHPHEEVA